MISNAMTPKHLYLTYDTVFTAHGAGHPRELEPSLHVAGLEPGLAVLLVGLRRDPTERAGFKTSYRKGSEAVTDLLLRQGLYRYDPEAAVGATR